MEQYERKVIAGASGATPGAGPAPAPVQDSSGSMVARGLDDLLKTAGQVMAREYAASETARVDDALLKTQGRMNQWLEQYRQTAQGNMASAEEIAGHWQELATEAMEDFGGANNEVFRDLLRRRLDERGLQVAADGLAYAGREHRQFVQSQIASQTDEFYRNAAARPEDIEGMIREREALKGSIAAKSPGKDLTQEFNAIDEKGFIAMAEGLLEKGDAQGVRNLLNNPATMSGGRRAVGSISERFESGGQGIATVAWDRNGGTSYGPWQLSSKQGSFEGWLQVLARQGERGQALAAQLRAAGNPNTGTTSGAAVAVYQKLARENEDLFRQTQAIYLKDTHLEPALKSLPPSLRKLIEDDDGLMEMAFSTSVQHGPGGAARILGRAFGEGMGRDAYIDAVYASRGRPENFRSSTPQVRAAVARRMQEEAEAVRNYRGVRNVIDPRVRAAYLAKADAIDRQMGMARQAELRNAVENYMAASESGNVLDLPCDEATLRGAFGDFQGGQLWKNVSESRELALDLNMLGNMTPAARANLLAERAPDPQSTTYREDAERHARLTRAVDILKKKFADDPAGAVLALDQNASRALQAFRENMNPDTARRYVAAMRAGMQDRGIAGPLLAKEDAQRLAAEFEQGEDPAGFAQGLQQAFGRDYPAVVASISKKMSPLMHIVAGGMDATAARLIVAASRDKDFAKNSKELLRLRGVDGTEFEENVRESLGEMLRTFTAAGNSEMPLALQDAVSSLALQYMRLEGPATKQGRAIERAYEAVLGSRYEMIEHKSFWGRKMPPCRVPRKLFPGGPDLSVDDVRDALSATLASLDVNELLVERQPGMLPEQEAQALASQLASQAWWVTDGDDGGVVLFWNNNAVLRKDGSVFRLSWQELLNRKARLDQAAKTGSPW